MNFSVTFTLIRSIKLIFFVFLKLKIKLLIIIINLAKRLLQISHEKGFSPVWVRMCVVRWSEREKALVHTVHLKGLSPVWILRWRVSSSERENRLGQPITVQACGLSFNGVLLGLLGYFRGFNGKKLDCCCCCCLNDSCISNLFSSSFNR